MSIKNYECEGQMSLFDFIEKPKLIEDHLPCDTCGHDIKGCCDYDYINNHDYCVLGDKWIPKAPEHIPPIHRYLRYGPHTLIPEVREETKAWLDRNGVPEWVKWHKDSYPCKNCTWWDGIACRRGFLKTHREYGYLICDNFRQSIVERTPATVGDACPSLKNEPRQDTTDEYIQEHPSCFYVFGYYLDSNEGWHKVPDFLPTFTEWTKVDVVVYGKQTCTPWMELDKWEAKDWTFRSLDDRRNTESITVLAWKISDDESLT